MKQQAIEKILDYLTSIPAWYLATVEDDQPHVRPFSFAAAQDERIWFCTATTKDVYRELERNPKFELTAWKPGSGWIILRGRADLDDRVDDDIRRAGYKHLVGLGEYYDSRRSDAHVLLFHRCRSVGVRHRRQLGTHRAVRRRRGSRATSQRKSPDRMRRTTSYAIFHHTLKYNCRIATKTLSLNGIRPPRPHPND